MPGILNLFQILVSHCYIAKFRLWGGELANGRPKIIPTKYVLGFHSTAPVSDLPTEWLQGMSSGQELGQPAYNRDF